MSLWNSVFMTSNSKIIFHSENDQLPLELESRLSINDEMSSCSSQELSAMRSVLDSPALLSGVLFETRIGWIAVAGLNGLISDVRFGYRSERDLRDELVRRELIIDETTTLPKAFVRARDLLMSFADGKQIDFTRLQLDLGKKTEFQKQIIEATRRIPYGKTLSYGELASEAGYPKAARAVGSVMSTNRIPLIIPCHRVIASGGKPGGFSAPGELTTKMQLLQMEAGQLRKF
jgi:methylated-DNA-[protein]-cysteine S-methyltransferase